MFIYMLKNELSVEPIKWANADSALFELDEVLCVNPDEMQTNKVDGFKREYLNLNENQINTIDILPIPNNYNIFVSNAIVLFLIN